MTISAPTIAGRDMVDPVASWLGWPAEAVARLFPFADAGPPPWGFELATDESSRALLRRLNVPAAAVDEIVRAKPNPRGHPEAWWLLERLYHTLTARDAFDAPPPWPAPFVSRDPLTHYFHLYVFLAAVPELLRFHGRRDIPARITWRTLRDVGLQVANYQTRHGRPGFDAAFWVWPHFRGRVFTLGRLQFEAPTKGAELGVHIPALGPLMPAACDDSFDEATRFFARHFPENPYRVATCQSWLLDEQLAEYLPPTSNIMRFQRRFTPDPRWTRPGDEDVLRFVFGHLPRSLTELPQNTSLQRAVVAHLQAGRHWQFRRGSFVL